MTPIERRLKVIKHGADIIDDFSCVARGTREEVDRVRVWAGAAEEGFDLEQYHKWDLDDLRVLTAIVHAAHHWGADCAANPEEWRRDYAPTAEAMWELCALTLRNEGVEPVDAYALDIDQERMDAAEEAFEALSDEQREEFVTSKIGVYGRAATVAAPPVSGDRPLTWLAGPRTCPLCGEPSRRTPSGWTCKLGHKRGGV